VLVLSLGSPLPAQVPSPQDSASVYAVALQAASAHFSVPTDTTRPTWVREDSTPEMSLGNATVIGEATWQALQRLLGNIHRIPPGDTVLLCPPPPDYPRRRGCPVLEGGRIVAFQTPVFAAPDTATIEVGVIVSFRGGSYAYWGGFRVVRLRDGTWVLADTLWISIS
jgi:hypothetical protein